MQRATCNVGTYVAHQVFSANNNECSCFQAFSKIRQKTDKLLILTNVVATCSQLSRDHVHTTEFSCNVTFALLVFTRHKTIPIICNEILNTNFLVDQYRETYIFLTRIFFRGDPCIYQAHTNRTLALPHAFHLRDLKLLFKIMTALLHLLLSYAQLYIMFYQVKLQYLSIWNIYIKKTFHRVITPQFFSV